MSDLESMVIRNKRIQSILTEEEFSSLEEKAQQEYMTVSGYVRKVLVKNGTKQNNSD